VAFAISGVISLAIIAALDSYLIHQAIDKSSAEYSALSPTNQSDVISVFRYPDLPLNRGGCVYRRLGNGD
jgi:hypothetical protein